MTDYVPSYLTDRVQFVKVDNTYNTYKRVLNYDYTLRENVLQSVGERKYQRVYFTDSLNWSVRTDFVITRLPGELIISGEFSKMWTVPHGYMPIVS